MKEEPSEIIESIAHQKASEDGYEWYDTNHEHYMIKAILEFLDSRF